MTSYLLEWLSSKSLQITHVGEDVKIRKLSCTTGGNVNWFSHYGEQYEGSFKTQNRTTI